MDTKGRSRSIQTLTPPHPLNTPKLAMLKFYAVTYEFYFYASKYL